MAGKMGKSYHHGDLKRTLLDAGLELVASDGWQDLSLRGLAAAAGVSRAAPYAHFRDKAELLSAIADAGFSRMAESMRESCGDEADVEAQFLGVGRGYLRFALENPNLFKLMFSRHPDDEGAASEAPRNGAAPYALLGARLDAFLSARGRGGGDRALIRTMAWSLVHGMALLMIERRLPLSDAARRELIDQATCGFARLLEGQGADAMGAATAGRPAPASDGAPSATTPGQ
jgi:AcrR family transcriptional regulator